MAYIYMAGGWSIRVPASREAVVNDMREFMTENLLTYEVELPAGSPRSRTEVVIQASQIAAVSDESFR